MPGAGAYPKPRSNGKGEYPGASTNGAAGDGAFQRMRLYVYNWLRSQGLLPGQERNRGCEHGYPCH